MMASTTSTPSTTITRTFVLLVVVVFFFFVFVSTAIAQQQQTLFGISTHPPSDVPDLVTIDPSSGSVTVVQSYPILGFDVDTVYSFTGEGPTGYVFGFQWQSAANYDNFLVVYDIDAQTLNSELVFNSTILTPGEIIPSLHGVTAQSPTKLFGVSSQQLQEQGSYLVSIDMDYQSTTATATVLTKLPLNFPGVACQYIASTDKIFVTLRNATGLQQFGK